jgi:hypothetical protein
MLKKPTVLTRPTPARQDALFRGQGRSERVKMILQSLLVYVAQDGPDEPPLRASNEGLFRPRVARAQGTHPGHPPLLAGFFIILRGIFN